MPRFLLLALLGVFCLARPVLAQTATQPEPPTVTASLQKKRRIVLLDVRTPAEFATGHLKGARNLDFRAPGFGDQVSRLDKSQTYVLYCASGNRSGQTTVLMEETGFKKIINAGAFKDLEAAGLATEK
ncbi:MAG: rhodanese-like domain-containing protein [Hymenobacter sp.]|nr:rhodanese-like domain-containing protein [Hymenobacter sp.]